MCCFGSFFSKRWQSTLFQILFLTLKRRFRHSKHLQMLRQETRSKITANCDQQRQACNSFTAWQSHSWLHPAFGHANWKTCLLDKLAVCFPVPSWTNRQPHAFHAVIFFSQSLYHAVWSWPHLRVIAWNLSSLVVSLPPLLPSPLHPFIPHPHSRKSVLWRVNCVSVTLIERYDSEGIGLSVKPYSKSLSTKKIDKISYES